MKNVFIVLLIIFYIGTHQTVIAENKIFINEFLIDPLPQQVEIINLSTQSADISGFYIDDSGGSTYYTIPQSSILLPNSCLVFNGDFNFNKSSADSIRLFDMTAPPTSTNAFLLDSFSYKSSSGSGISYFRFPDGSNNWTTGSANLSKYNTNQSLSCLLSLTLTPAPSPTLYITPTVTLTITPTATPIPINNIYISEVMVNPLSGQKEWLEIYNNNDFDVSLIDWYVDDVENSGASPKKFSLNIPAKKYMAITLNSSMFNNEGDIVRLLDNNKNQIDSFEYQGSQQGKSYGRSDFDNDSFCQQDSTFELSNSYCIYTSPTISPTVKPTEILLVTSAINTKSNKYPTINPPQHYPDENIVIVPTIQAESVLGATTKILNPKKLLIKVLSGTSAAYSLLTLVSILFKMIFIYGKGKEFLLTSFRA